MVGRTYIGNHLCCILNREGVGLMVLEDFEKVFQIICLWRQLIPRAWPVQTPTGLFGRIYTGDHKALLQTKYISCGLHGFREEDL